MKLEAILFEQRFQLPLGRGGGPRRPGYRPAAVVFPGAARVAVCAGCRDLFGRRAVGPEIADALPALEAKRSL